ncbi:hypothetical protein KFE25_006751 [Diacronema lutheri]|uniref:Uncharacterized protein n=2 Tax=Diacronema lutheri TaxID=2081491 RepID=A0A8J5XPK0_DIALT|nr:hypothetical protein KFE25_006751 [Diacronema lutheri]
MLTTLFGRRRPGAGARADARGVEGVGAPPAHASNPAPPAPPERIVYSSAALAVVSSGGGGGDDDDAPTADGASAGSTLAPVRERVARAYAADAQIEARLLGALHALLSLRELPACPYAFLARRLRVDEARALALALEPARVLPPAAPTERWYAGSAAADAAAAADTAIVHAEGDRTLWGLRRVLARAHVPTARALRDALAPTGLLAPLQASEAGVRVQAVSALCGTHVFAAPPAADGNGAPLAALPICARALRVREVYLATGARGRFDKALTGFVTRTMQQAVTLHTMAEHVALFVVAPGSAAAAGVADAAGPHDAAAAVAGGGGFAPAGALRAGAHDPPTASGCVRAGVRVAPAELRERRHEYASEARRAVLAGRPLALHALVRVPLGAPAVRHGRQRPAQYAYVRFVKLYDFCYQCNDGDDGDGGGGGVGGGGGSGAPSPRAAVVQRASGDRSTLLLCARPFGGALVEGIFLEARHAHFVAGLLPAPPRRRAGARRGGGGGARRAVREGLRPFYEWLGAEACRHAAHADGAAAAECALLLALGRADDAADADDGADDADDDAGERRADGGGGGGDDGDGGGGGAVVGGAAAAVAARKGEVRDARGRRARGTRRISAPSPPQQQRPPPPLPPDHAASPDQQHANNALMSDAVACLSCVGMRLLRAHDEFEIARTLLACAPLAAGVHAAAPRACAHAAADQARAAVPLMHAAFARGAAELRALLAGSPTAELGHLEAPLRALLARATDGAAADEPRPPPPPPPQPLPPPLPLPPPRCVAGPAGPAGPADDSAHWASVRASGAPRPPPPPPLPPPRARELRARTHAEREETIAVLDAICCYVRAAACAQLHAAVGSCDALQHMLADERARAYPAVPPPADPADAADAAGAGAGAEGARAAWAHALAAAAAPRIEHRLIDVDAADARARARRAYPPSISREAALLQYCIDTELDVTLRALLDGVLGARVLAREPTSAVARALLAAVPRARMFAFSDDALLRARAPRLTLVDGPLGVHATSVDAPGRRSAVAGATREPPAPRLFGARAALRFASAPHLARIARALERARARPPAASAAGAPVRPAWLGTTAVDGVGTDAGGAADVRVHWAFTGARACHSALLPRGGAPPALDVLELTVVRGGSWEEAIEHWSAGLLRRVIERHRAGTELLLSLAIGGRVWSVHALAAERKAAERELCATAAAGDAIVAMVACLLPAAADVAAGSGAGAGADVDVDVDDAAAPRARARYVLLGKRAALWHERAPAAPARAAGATAAGRASGLDQADAFSAVFADRAGALALARACDALRGTADARARDAARAAHAAALRAEARASCAAGDAWAACGTWLSAACAAEADADADDEAGARDAGAGAGEGGGGEARADVLDGVRLQLTGAAQLAQLAERNLALSAILNAAAADEAVRAAVRRGAVARMLRSYRARVAATLAADTSVYLEPVDHLVRESMSAADFSAATLSADALVALSTVQQYLDAVLHVACGAALDNLPRLAARLRGERPE